LLQESGAFPLELWLNSGELVSVVSAHADKLEFHASDEFVNVGVHLLHGLDVVLVLGLNGFLKLLFELVFVLNNVLALDDLLFDILVQLLAVFLLFKLLPVPIDLNVLLVGGDDFVLDLIGSFAASFLFLDAASVFSFVSVRFYLSDR
jgi:hypothetical protein